MKLKFKKILLLFIFTIISLFINSNIVNALADGFPKSLTSLVQDSNGWLTSNGGKGETYQYKSGTCDNSGSNVCYSYFRYKYSTDASNIPFTCISGIDTVTPIGRTCNLSTDESILTKKQKIAIAYILNKYPSNSNLENYYWAEVYGSYYMGGYVGSVCGQRKDSSGKTYISDTSKNAKCENIKKEANNYADKVTDFKAYLSSVSLNFKIDPTDNNYFKSDEISITGSNDLLNLSTVDISDFVSDVSGLIINKTDDHKFVVRVPKDKVPSGKSYVIRVRAKWNIYFKATYAYNCGANIQNVIINKFDTLSHGGALVAMGTITRSKLSISKIDSDGNYVAGAKLLLTSDKGYSKEFTSGTSPIVIEDLPLAKYTLKETKAPDGYVLSNETKTIELNNSNLSGSLTILNNKQGTISISKREITKEEELVGATLTILDKDKKAIDITGIKTTVALISGNGLSWVSTNVPNQITGLKAGTYYLIEEQAPSYFIRNKSEVKFTVTDDGKITLNSEKSEMYSAYGSHIVLNNKKIELLFSKMDIADDKELKGATIKIYKEDSNDEVLSFVSTGSPYKFSLPGSGKYKLVEEVAPNGYKKILGTYTFELTEDGKIKLLDKEGRNVKIENNNRIILYNELIEFNFYKKDFKGDKVLEGANIVVSYIEDLKDDVVLYNFKTTKKPTKLRLEPGRYKIVETSAPKGYELIKTIYIVEVSEEGSIKLISESGTNFKINGEDIILYNELVNVPDTGVSGYAYLFLALALVSGGVLFIYIVKHRKLA